MAQPYKPYEKMAHSTRNWSEKTTNGEFIASEKVHGANFSFVCSTRHDAAVVETQVRHAKRSRVIEAGENFYGFRSVIPRRYDGSMKALFNELSQSPPSTCGLAMELLGGPITTVIVYGELCGGFYPSLLLRKTSRGSFENAVQTGIHYSPDLQFVAFDVAIASQPADGPERVVLLGHDAMSALCERHGITCSPVVGRGTLQQMLDIPCRFTSRVPQAFDLPALDEGSDENFAEGLVVKSAAPWLIGEAPRPILKRKIPEFSETKYSEDRQGFGNATRATDPGQWLDMLTYEALAMVTPQRVAAVASKLGRITPELARTILKSLLDDIICDLEGELEPEFVPLLDSETALLREKCTNSAKDAIRAAYRGSENTHP